MATININTSKVPEWSMYQLLQAVYNDQQRFFAQPGIKEKFELWKQQHEEEK